jgi:hypothetical protein
VQLAITAFYDLRPARRTSAPQYPEIYLFHVGGRYGNHSFFDYWPPRKEVFLDNDACAVLSAVNDKAITRLVVADGKPTPAAYDPWEPAAAGDRISSAFAYSASGWVANADVRLSSRNERAEVNATMTLHPDRALARLMSAEGSEDADRA